MVSVEYDAAGSGLHEDLFVKFSRDLENPIRDRGRDQMESEARFGLLSRTPGFPITTPQTYFAEYQRSSGTGILITERIAFGAGPIERHYEKCLDHQMPEPLEHYKALVATVARLAGAHKAGRLPDYVDQSFPFDVEQARAADRIRHSSQQLQNRIARFAEFGSRHGALLPPNTLSPAFVARMERDAPRLLEHETRIKRYLCSQPDNIALCHWNANVDNAWFWRGQEGVLECGLLDWGRVGQMNVALALAGGLMSAGLEIWNRHLEELLALFADEYRGAGGPQLDPAELVFQVSLFVASTGLAWLMDAPALLRATVPDLEDVLSPLDARIVDDETARTQLHMFSVFLNLWETRDFGAQLDELLRRT
jgi:hypothetical protein